MGRMEHSFLKKNMAGEESPAENRGLTIEDPGLKKKRALPEARVTQRENRSVVRSG